MISANIPTSTRKAIYRRDGYRCALCDSTQYLQIHHIIPRGKGGNNEPDNLITLCSKCHGAAHGCIPEGWAVAQEFLFCDATSFLSYNANMRQLMVDKLKSAELVVLNRYNDSMDRMEMHRIIRAISRRCDIAYEYTDGKVVYDDIEDPLPFDLDAPVVEIEDRDFAIWYRDMSEEPKKYDGKTIEVKCRCLVRKNVPKGCFIAGRHIMTCCVQDIQFAGIICVWDRADEIRNDEWAVITARLDYKFHRAYGRKGPVFTVQSVQEVEKPEEPVATFY